jgi:hypothetical protein
MVAEFNKKWEEPYKIKTTAALQSVIDKRNAAHRKNVKTVCDRNVGRPTLRSQGQMEMTTMRRASLRRASLNMRLRMGRGEGVKQHSCKNGDRHAGFTSHQKQSRG